MITLIMSLKILKMRFGLEDSEPKTLKEIGVEMR